jgi:hypothetical protein
MALPMSLCIGAESGMFSFQPIPRTDPDLLSFPSLRVPLPPPDAPLSELKARISSLTGVAPNHMKLITSGFVLKDDRAPLSACGLGSDDADGSSKGFFKGWGWGWSQNPASPPAPRRHREKIITMIGSPETQAVVSDRLPTSSSSSSSQQTPTRAEPPARDEPSIVAAIAKIADGALGDALPKIDSLERGELADTQPAQHVVLSEVLLQNLLKVDSFDIKPEWTEARKARKDAVKRIQG